MRCSIDGEGMERGCPGPQPIRSLGTSLAPSEGSGVEPRQKMVFMLFALEKTT